MSAEPISDTVDDIIRLAELALLFGRTPRATFHEDGKRVETDTDHTVMLSLIACSLAEKYYPNLDLGLVAQFAIVHDLVEAYAGDTPTLRISAKGKQTKEQQELAAMKRIEDEFAGSLPLIPSLLKRYEKRIEAEARFVKAVDKIIPKTTHILNHAATLKAQSITRAEAVNTYTEQSKDMLVYASDFPEVLLLHEELVSRTLREVPR